MKDSTNNSFQKDNEIEIEFDLEDEQYGIEESDWDNLQEYLMSF